MESTTKVYTASMKKYFKNLVEMEIGWLQFLASFGKIRCNNRYDLGNELYKVKEDLLNSLDAYDKDMLCLNAKEVQELITQYIKASLPNYGLEEVIPYINYGLDEGMFSDFMTLKYVRSMVGSLFSDLRIIRDYLKGIDDNTSREIASLIEQVTTMLPSAYIKSNVVGEGLMDYYCGEVGIGYSEDGSGSAYIYMIFMLLDRINSYLMYTLPEEYQSDIKPVSQYINSFIDLTYLNEGGNYIVNDLTNVFDALKFNIELYKSSLNNSLSNKELLKKY